MITAGVDIGSTTLKVVVLRDHITLHHTVRPTGPLPACTAAAALDETLTAAGLTRADVAVIATTGYGRRLVDFGDIVLTEIKACATGVLSATGPASPVRTIIDVGGQDTKVISLTETGDIEDFSMNDKCAAGTGRFLEVLADKLTLSYDDFVRAADSGCDTLLHMSSTCAVFAESEVVGLIARGEKKADVAAAAHHAIASRIASMVRRVGARSEYCFVGGGARNHALVKAVEEQLNAPVRVPAHAQIIVALGAALNAQRQAGRE
jgi:predicted CoA-substrate-specific enzyme activase